MRTDQVHAVAVCKFLGMGSIIQATPMLRALRCAFPEARIILITAVANKPLGAMLPMVDKVRVVDDRGLCRLALTSWRVLWSMARRKVDLYFDLEVHSAYSAGISLLSLARNRYGFYRYSTRFKRGIHTHLMYFNPHQPIARIYLQLSRMAGAVEQDANHLGPIQASESARQSLHRKLSALSSESALGSFLVVNPNASDLLVERRWPAMSFIGLIEKWAGPTMRVVVIGGVTDVQYVQKLVAQLSPAARRHVVDTSGLLDLPELAALLREATCVVTNDSGPMHLAIAVGAPTVCLFGPVDPRHYGIQNERVRIVYEPVFCSPCVHELDGPPCRGHNVCMQRISVGRVNQAIAELLARVPDTTGSDSTSFVNEDLAGRPLGMITSASVAETRSMLCEVCGQHEFDLRLERGDQRLWRCRTCGLVCQFPQPSEEALSRVYGDEYYCAWGQGDSARAIKADFFRRQLRQHALRGSGRLLDCGAATGYLMEVAQEMGWTAYGVELSVRGSAAIARRFGSDRVQRSRFEDATFPTLEQPAFDVITMFDFIEHVRHPRRVLGKAASFLKPGGVLLLCTPDTRSMSFRLMKTRWPHLKMEHLYYFGRRNVSRLLIESGFMVEYIGPAIKTMSLEYLSAQFKIYPVPIIGATTILLAKLAPVRVRHHGFPMGFGEMIVRARRIPSDTPNHHVVCTSGAETNKSKGLARRDA